MKQRHIVQLCEDLRQGRTTATELVEIYAERITTLNPNLNALSQLRLDAARAEALACDEARRQGQTLGPLAGIPCTIKEAFHVAGLRSTGGATHLQNNWVEEDAPAVARLKAAGAIILGKTNIPAMTADWQTYNEIFGTTVNPWNKARSSGGSSGGAAAAVASQMSVFDLASDLCGCMRIPAHFCGVFAHRPSYGLTSVRGHVPGDPAGNVEPDLSSSGPITRSAKDLRFLMQILCEPWVDLPASMPALAERKDTSLRVLVWLGTSDHKIDTAMRQHIETTLNTLEASVNVEFVYGAPAEFDLEEVIDLAMTLTGRLLSTASSPLGRVVSALNAFGLKFRDSTDKRADFAWALAKGEIGTDKIDQTRAEVNSRVDAFFDRFDLLITPVAPVPAIEHDFAPTHQRVLTVDNQAVPYNEFMVWNALASVFALPATIIPLGIGVDGLPIGIQVIGKRFHDSTCIEFAERVEAVLPANPLPKDIDL